MRRVRSLTSLSTGFLLTVVLAGLAPAASADNSSPEVVATLGAVHRAAAAPRVGAAVTVGQSSGFTSFGKCTGAAPLASTVHASGGGATYTMPFAGVLTSYSTRTGPTAGSVRALAFVDGATNHKTLVGKSLVDAGRDQHQQHLRHPRPGSCGSQAGDRREHERHVLRHRRGPGGRHARVRDLQPGPVERHELRRRPPVTGRTSPPSSSRTSTATPSATSPRTCARSRV